MSELLPHVAYETDPLFARIVDAIIVHSFPGAVAIEYPTLRSVRALASAVLAAIRDHQAAALAKPDLGGDT